MNLTLPLVKILFKRPHKFIELTKQNTSGQNGGYIFRDECRSCSRSRWDPLRRPEQWTIAGTPLESFTVPPGIHVKSETFLIVSIWSTLKQFWTTLEPSGPGGSPCQKAISAGGIEKELRGRCYTALSTVVQTNNGNPIECNIKSKRNLIGEKYK